MSASAQIVMSETDLYLSLEFIKMTSKIVGLRVSSVIFGLVCLAHIARLWARTDVFIGSYHLGRIPSLLCIIASGGLSIWLAKLAGPWCVEAEQAPRPKI